MKKSKTSSKYAHKNIVKLIHGGKEYFDLLLQLINEATESIHLQTYIFDDDDTGKMVAAALKAAAKRKVEVYVMADGFASQSLDDRFIKELDASGIHFRFFEPFFKSKHYYFGRRMHHKVFVTDAKFALVGGVNIADRYNDMPGIPSWRDFAVYVEGETAKELYVFCWRSWYGFPKKMVTVPFEEKALVFHPGNKHTSPVRIRRNDWVTRKNEITLTYREMFRHAQSHITIMCSYFLPGRVLRKLLRIASARGVKIRLITAGPSDVKVAKWAERWMYDWLLRNKIALYEYMPTVLHAKVSVCDGKWLTIGSYNLNNISAYASLELNLDINDPFHARALEKELDDIIKKDCIEITEQEHRRTNNIFKQFVRWCSYEFIRIVFYLTTFYFKQKEY